MRTRALLLVLLLAAASLTAQDRDAEPTGAQENTSDAAERTEAAQEATDPPAPAARPGAPRDTTGTPQRFEPSEKVRADFDVSFPVDI